MNIKVAPSLLAADFSQLGEEIRRVKDLAIDFLHIDIMDGHFVPNISIGPAVVRDIRPLTTLPLEAHLMISQPRKFIDSFLKAGVNIITLHAETITNSEFRLEAGKLRKQQVKVGIAINPETPVSCIGEVLDICDLVLIMTVNPGFGGQKFIADILPKISQLRSQYDGDIAVDGGIDNITAGLTIKAGANVLASGTYIFKSENKSVAIERLRECREQM